MDKIIWKIPYGEIYVEKPTTRRELRDPLGIEPTTFRYPSNHRGYALRETKGPIYASEILLLLVLLHRLLLLLLLLLPRLVLLHCLLLLQMLLSLLCPLAP